VSAKKEGNGAGKKVHEISCLINKQNAKAEKGILKKNGSPNWEQDTTKGTRHSGSGISLCLCLLRVGGGKHDVSLDEMRSSSEKKKKEKCSRCKPPSKPHVLSRPTAAPTNTTRNIPFL